MALHRVVPPLGLRLAPHVMLRIDNALTRSRWQLRNSLLTRRPLDGGSRTLHVQKLHSFSSQSENQTLA